MKAFAGIAQAATASNALDAKTKKLIALGIAVAVRCDDCIAFHAKAAVEHGATKDEVSETLGKAIYMGAGPSVMYATSCFRSIHAVRGIKTNRAMMKRGVTSATFHYAFSCSVPFAVRTYSTNNLFRRSAVPHFWLRREVVRINI